MTSYSMERQISDFQGIYFSVLELEACPFIIKERALL